MELIWNEARNCDKFFVNSNLKDVLSLTQIYLVLERQFLKKVRRLHFVELDSKCLDLGRKSVECELT